MDARYYFSLHFKYSENICAAIRCRMLACQTEALRFLLKKPCLFFHCYRYLASFYTHAPNIRPCCMFCSLLHLKHARVFAQLKRRYTFAGYFSLLPSGEHLLGVTLIRNHKRLNPNTIGYLLTKFYLKHWCLRGVDIATLLFCFE